LSHGTTMPPLLLDDEEVVAVAVALRTTAGAGVSDIEEASLRALVKLEQLLPTRLRHRIDAVRTATVNVPGTGPTVDPAVLSAIAGAIRASERLRFDYVDHNGRLTTRTGEPPPPRGRGGPRALSRGAALRPRRPYRPADHAYRRATAPRGLGAPLVLARLGRRPRRLAYLPS